MANILMLVGDYVEDYEVMVPFQALQMIGHQVDTICPDKKKGDYIKTAIHDFEGNQTYSEKRGHNFILNATFSKIDIDDYDALLIPGGRAPEYIRLNEDVISIVKTFMKKDKPVGAICHGIQILTAAHVVNRRSCTAYPTLKHDVMNAGGRWVDTPLDSVCIDYKLITAPAWSAHPKFLAEFIKLLEG